MVVTAREDDAGSPQDAALVIRCITTPIFSIELALRILAKGPQKFLRRGVNIVDTIAVVGCWFSIWFPTTVPGLGCLRVVRLVRIVVEVLGLDIVHKVASCVLYNPRYDKHLLAVGSDIYIPGGADSLFSSLDSLCVWSLRSA